MRFGLSSLSAVGLSRIVCVQHFGYWGAMGGILHIAYKLLVNDRAKYAALLVGLRASCYAVATSPLKTAGLARNPAT